MTQPPQAILDLVERFDRNVDLYRSPSYNETQARREFIDPFFVALGWDVDNKRGVSPRYREVIHEASLRARGSVTAPDYCFRVGTERKFFVEAKKPAVSIKYNIQPAYQLRRYAWTAKLPLSILTDFEEFSVYDCRFRPKAGDKASQARLLSLTYDQYPDRWDEIAGIFSREAVWKGDYDRYAETTRGKRGTQEVDREFLKEIEGWRVALARNIALRNEDLSVRELNYAVQKTIDRILFLRICEDRGIEPYEQLRDIANGTESYGRLLDLFRRADERFNSGIFHFREEKGRNETPDSLTPTLSVDDKVLRGIISKLYYPDSPYEFSVLSVEILGNVYEQFLGSVIRLTRKHRAVVEQKPEVRKAGGVYYTPRYIVDYIVEHTVGELCKGKTLGQVARLRILDPACGSGSFLLGAYEYLLDYHLDWYVEHPTKRGRQEVYEGRGGDWFLTTEEKKRILLNNIYGVDIDPQAVEVTKLSLLLKVLEGETRDSLGQQLELIRERALPDLASNIKCGNSLIGPDFYDREQMSLLDAEEMYRINPFDWQAQFAEIMSQGGFDAVVGNPPYIRVHRLDREIKEYLWKHFPVFAAKSDLYACFVQQGIRLLAPKGRMSFITPNTWTSLESFTSLREFVLTNTQVDQLVRTPKRVFKDAAVRTFIFVVTKLAHPHLPAEHRTVIRDLSEGGAVRDRHVVRQQAMFGSHLHNLLLETDPRAPELLSRCTSAGIRVGEVLAFLYGFKTADDEKFLHSRATSEYHRPYARSASVSRYGQIPVDGFVDYRPDAMRANRKTARPGDRARFERPKLVVARMGRELITTVDRSRVYVKDAMLLLSPDDDWDQLLAACGLLNSRLLRYLYESFFITIDVLKNALLSLPLAIPGDVARRDRLVALVERMLALHKQLADANTPMAKELLQRQIDATDRQIDGLVYELYGLTEEEIGIVEEATA